MSVKDPFEILADELTLLRRQIDQLQRTSLDKDEARQLNAAIAESLDDMAQLGPRVVEAVEVRLKLSLAETRLTAAEAARQAAVEAIRSSQEETTEAARSLLRAAHGARVQAWRYVGGFWGWLSAAAALGGLLGAVVVTHLQSRADAADFGRFPSIYCDDAGGTIATGTDGRRFCGVWIDPPAQIRE